ncbi:MAG TPA: protein kinase, partial [Myxococcota bacterium]
RQARFEREVRAAGRLVHQNVCRVLSFGRAPAQLFMAMEIVHGLTLQKVIKARGTVPIPVALEALRQLLLALQCAHQAGVVHRDLKPANVMITPEGVLKLLDFGIAKSQEDATVTATGLLIGTPAFMAPEQILGTAGTDSRSDLFSAGVTFLVMLMGRTRFSGMEPATVMMKVTSEPVPSLLEDCPHAPVAVDRFLQKLCAQSVSDRFATAGDALAALQLIEELPVERDGPALLAQYVREPDVVAGSLARVCAEAEVRRADRLLRTGPAAQPAAALALHRAHLLDPAEATRKKLTDLCALAAFTFDPVDDPKIVEAMAAFAKTPMAPGVLKRLADLYRARGHVQLAAAFLTRYLRVKPTDTVASMQLHVMLDGPGDAPATGERLRTRDIMSGIKTGGHVDAARPIRPEARPEPVLRPVMASQANASPPSSAVSSGLDTHARARSVPRAAPASGTLTTATIDHTIVVAGASDDTRLRVHPLLLLIGAVVVAGIVLAFFSRFVKTTVDDVQLAVSDNEGHGAAIEANNIERMRKNYLVDAQGQLDRGNWAAAARAVNLLLASSPPAEVALPGMWIRAQARLKLNDKRSARGDLEEYLKQTPITDGNRDEAKKLLDEIYAGEAAAAGGPALPSGPVAAPTPKGLY